MATQRDVQQLIQGLTPSGVNNGNPNTAYNNKTPSPSGGGIPQLNGNGQWFMPQLTPAVNVELPIVQQMGIGNGGFNWMGNGGAIGGGPLPPATGGGTTPPATGGGGGGTGPGGNLPPGTVQPNVGGPNGGPLGGLGGGSLTPQNSLSPWQGGFNGSMFGVNIPGNTGSFGGGGGAAAPSGGNTPSGGINWNQVLDAVSEPILAGNFYDPATGKWNMTNVAGSVLGIPNLEGWWHEGQGQVDISNILASIGQMATGLPIGSLMNRLGQYGASQGWSLNNPFVDAWLDNSREAYIQRNGQLGPLAPGMPPMAMPLPSYMNAPATDAQGNSWQNAYGAGGAPAAGGGSGGSSGPAYNAAVAAMGGASEGGGHGSMWTGVSGDAARSMFGGMSTGATDALQHAEMMAMKLQRQ